MTTQTNTSLTHRFTNVALATILGLSAATYALRAEAFEVTAEQREACMGDAFRLCSSEIPDVDRVLVCMRANKQSLSSHCRAVLPR